MLNYRLKQCVEMNVVLLDTLSAIQALRPFSYTRPLSLLRVGIRTLEEKWKHYLGDSSYSYWTSAHLREKFPCRVLDINLCINSTICADDVVVEAIRQLEDNQQLIQEDTFIAARCDRRVLEGIQHHYFSQKALKSREFEGQLTRVVNKWDLFLLAEQELLKDFQQMTCGVASQPIQDPHTIVYQKHNVFVSPGATIKAAILNAEEGPIYIGPRATIHERAVIKGPVAICQQAHVQPGACLRQATVVGPFTKVGGEVVNTVFLGYSNKAHEGFVGNSVIGNWCNLGAGTQASNLRNDYANVKVWDVYRKEFVKTPLQFCGLFMGDYSKCGINTSFSAGTTVGVNANLFGVEIPYKNIPSFTWGTPSPEVKTYVLEKALLAAERMMLRRMVTLEREDRAILAEVFSLTALERN